MGDTVVRKHFTDAKQDLGTLECYRLNKILLRMIGQWPFSPLWQRRLGTIIFVCGLGSFWILEIVYLVKNRMNFDHMIHCVAGIMTLTCVVMKMMNIVIAAESVKRIFVQIHNDWNANYGAAEQRILQQYSDKSKFFTLTYTVYLYTGTLLYVSGATIPTILNYINPLNESRQKILPSNVEYFIDEPTDHYWPIFFHQFFGTFCMITISITCDTTYVTFVQYICGIFASLNYKLNHLTDERTEEDFYASKLNNKGFAKLADCIDHHQKAIRLADEVEDAYFIANLMMMIPMVLAISLRAVEAAIHIESMDAVVFRYGTNCLSLLIHVFFLSLPGQALHDHSSSIFHAAYNCKWYSMSKKSRDLLRFIALRSLTPCLITAGKFYVMDLERFGMLVRTAMSYCLVLISMR